MTRVCLSCGSVTLPALHLYRNVTLGTRRLPRDPGSVRVVRSLALAEADVVLLLGARLNWMLHFGRPPRFGAQCRFIQVGRWWGNGNISAELFGQGCPRTLSTQNPAQG